ncbi:Tat pathway signal sequence domain protein [Streptomyces sp. NPDC048291]|uniref:Tat pathway signal sequence domain protein n=1 Tax=Streptomyces sp. NPDC048291 TaxID=3365530 RepID=UPI0037212CBB
MSMGGTSGTSGIGPVEPGEGTQAQDAPDAPEAAVSPPPHPARRRALAVAAAAALLAGGGYLIATRPHPPTPAPPEVPYPAQAVAFAFLDGRATPPGAPPRSFSFAVRMTVTDGPPVTVPRVTQPYAGLTLTESPPAPFRTKAGSPREITITMHVTDCATVPKDAGLPFLDVTLRNTRAIQVQSFILGSRYAQHLSHALKVACSNS